MVLVFLSLSLVAQSALPDPFQDLVTALEKSRPPQVRGQAIARLTSNGKTSVVSGIRYLQDRRNILIEAQSPNGIYRVLQRNGERASWRPANLPKPISLDSLLPLEVTTEKAKELSVERCPYFRAWCRVLEIHQGDQVLQIWIEQKNGTITLIEELDSERTAIRRIEYRQVRALNLKKTYWFPYWRRETDLRTGSQVTLLFQSALYNVHLDPRTFTRENLLKGSYK